MRWALDHRGDLVRADALGPYSFGLRCPNCKEPVFSRLGSVREAHFAHRSGNANKDCDDYYPGSGGNWQQVQASRAHVHPQKERLGAPALIWRSEEALAASLYLRLPTHPGGFLSTVRVVSFATSQYDGKALTRPVFVRLRLQSSTAEVETIPRDELLEQAIIETLDQFKLTSNFFRANGEGGVLVPRDYPLELGETYWLLTQTPLNVSNCKFIRVEERRADRAWHAYRLVLTYDRADIEAAIEEVSKCLSRIVIHPRPSIRLVWPLPERRDPDGVRVYGREVKEILIRSRAGQPQCRSHGFPDVMGEELEGDSYRIRIETDAGELVLGVPGGRWERIRFEACDLREPSAVTLSCESEEATLYEPKAVAIIAKELPIQIGVPVHRLWRNVLVNGSPIRPVPDGLTHVPWGLISKVSAGAFGSAIMPKSTIAKKARPWWTEIEQTVRSLKGNRAAEQLHGVEGKAQLLGWMLEHRAQILLPKLMLEICKGVHQ